MKKFSSVIIFSILFVLCSCQNPKTKKAGYEKVIGLNVIPSKSDFLIYEDFNMEKTVCNIDSSQTIQILEVSKKSDDFILKVLCKDENKNKSAGWCYLDDVNLLPGDYEKLADDFLIGLSYAGEFFTEKHSIKLEDCHPLARKIIETAYEKKFDEEKIIKAFDLILSQNEYYDYEKECTDSPLYFAVKYNYVKLTKLLNEFFHRDESAIYYPEQETLLACAIRNDSFETFEYLMSINGFLSDWICGNGNTYGFLAEQSKNPKYKELLDAPTVYFNLMEPVKKFQNIKEEPKDKKYDWNICRYFNSLDHVENYRFDNAFIKADSNTKINIRSLPDVESDKLGAVFNNSIVTVLDMSKEKSVIDGTASEWIKIRSSENIEGWVFGDYVYVSIASKPFQDATEENNFIFVMKYGKAVTRCPAKIIYHDMTEEMLNADETLYILDYFDCSDKEMVVIDNGCIFPYCVVRTQKGKTGVINSRDVANAYYDYYTRTVLNNPVTECKLNCTIAEEIEGGTSKKICGISFVNSKGESEDLFLPGTKIYNGIEDIVVRPHVNPDTKMEFPVIEIYEQITDSKKQNACLYTGKDGRMYIFAEYIHDMRYGNPLTDNDFTGSFYDREKNTIFRYSQEYYGEEIKCETWQYEPLKNDPQIFVLKEYFIK